MICEFIKKEAASVLMTTSSFFYFISIDRQKLLQNVLFLNDCAKIYDLFFILIKIKKMAQKCHEHKICANTQKNFTS